MEFRFFRSARDPGLTIEGYSERFDAIADLDQYLHVASRVLPEPARDRQRIDLRHLPPCGLVTMPAELAMMDTARRDSELVAPCDQALAAGRSADGGRLRVNGRTRSRVVRR
jgi:hypothetical protein